MFTRPTPRLRDVVAAQHRRLLSIIDRAESEPTIAVLRRVRSSLLAHLEAEAAIVHPLSGSTYGTEQHEVLKFVLDRIEGAKSDSERTTRIRVLRDLFVHHIEREEWITLQRVESKLDEATSALLGRRFSRDKPVPTRPRGGRSRASRAQ
jgi:hypothetical protein